MAYIRSIPRAYGSKDCIIYVARLFGHICTVGKEGDRLYEYYFILRNLHTEI